MKARVESVKVTVEEVNLCNVIVPPSAQAIPLSRDDLYRALYALDYGYFVPVVMLRGDAGIKVIYGAEYIKVAHEHLCPKKPVFGFAVVASSPMHAFVQVLIWLDDIARRVGAKPSKSFIYSVANTLGIKIDCNDSQFIDVLGPYLRLVCDKKAVEELKPEELVKEEPTLPPPPPTPQQTLPPPLPPPLPQPIQEPKTSHIQPLPPPPPPPPPTPSADVDRTKIVVEITNVLSKLDNATLRELAETLKATPIDYLMLLPQLLHYDIQVLLSLAERYSDKELSQLILNDGAIRTLLPYASELKYLVETIEKTAKKRGVPISDLFEQLYAMVMDLK